jgi:hypothetical protein
MTRRSLLATAASVVWALRAQAMDSLSLFEFRRSFWINLHHFLYAQALEDARDREDAGGDAGWAAAIRYYNEELIQRNLVSDPGLRSIKQRLAALTDEDSLTLAALEPEMTAALEGAAKLYRVKWWAKHDRANAEWIQSQMPRLAAHGEPIAGDLQRVFDFPWPAAPIHTEISYCSSTNGAYTTLDPPFIVIASGDARNQGETGLEILFHESSHVLSARMHRLLEAELAAHAKQRKAPPQLWHAVIFYCVGEVMRRNVPGYEPYAEQQKLWQREWPGLLPVLEAAFQDYIGGKGTLMGAVNGLVEGL